MSHNPRISLSTIDNIGRLTQAGTDSFTYDESIDTPLSITNANGTFYYHRDHQGSIVALTDSSGQVVESFTYDNHYGTIVDHTKTIETNNPYAYTGRELDTDELYYYRARYYDPSLERFLGEDPIGFSSGDFNFYGYVGNSPLNMTDPSGYLCISLGYDTKNLTESPIGSPQWIVERVDPWKKTNVGMCRWGKIQKMRRSQDKRSKEICWECDDPDPCYGRTSSCDIKVKYGDWHTITDTYDKRIGGASSTGIAGSSGWTCAPPSPWLPNSGL